LSGYEKEDNTDNERNKKAEDHVNAGSAENLEL
jgi:hypothetical protein